MKRYAQIWTILSAVALIVFQSPVYAGELFQISAMAPFAQGKYEGPVTFKELKQHGNLGIGTLNGLYGEMIALDGEFFQIKADGKAYKIADSERTPFAMVVDFKPDKKFPLVEANDMGKLYLSLDEMFHDPDAVCAFKIHGDFNRLKVRSVPKQEKPYPTLENALKNQTFFELKNVKGTLVGFRFPDYMKGVNAAGYHFHFITADKSAGGHVLECDVQKAQAEMESVSGLQIRLIPEIDSSN
jgi:acetolactate decarboxylase